MSDEWLKVTLICKPEQSGKTFIMIQTIIKDLNEPIDDKIIVNFILCDNNLLLTKQTSGRVAEDLNEFKFNEEVYLELSSHKRTDYHNHSDVFHAIITKKINNVICCTNNQRIDDIYQLITDFNTSDITEDKYHFKIWLDEADKFDKYINDTLKPLVKNFDNVSVYCITATPDTLFRKHKYMNVFPIEKTTTEKYHGWEDNRIRIIDFNVDYLSFITHVLTNVGKDRIVPKSKWFIPGLSKKKSHESVKKICNELGMAVVVVNGNGITLTLPNKETIVFPKDDEFGKKIVEIYEEYKLEKYAFVITGYICISRGITINSKKFMLDNAILSHCGSKSEVSQIAGRMKGNMKNFPNYKIPHVFTTIEFNKIAIDMEKKSRHLAELAFKKEQEGLETVIDKSEFKSCGENYRYVKHDEYFKTYAQAIKYLQSIYRECGMRKINDTKKSVIHLTEPNKYSVTSKLLKPGLTVKDLTEDDRITKKQAESIPLGRCISTTKKGSQYLILPVYDSLDSPPKSVEFEVRHLRKI